MGIGNQKRSGDIEPDILDRTTSLAKRDVLRDVPIPESLDCNTLCTRTLNSDYQTFRKSKSSFPQNYPKIPQETRKECLLSF